MYDWKLKAFSDLSGCWLELQIGPVFTSVEYRHSYKEYQVYTSVLNTSQWAKEVIPYNSGLTCNDMLSDLKDLAVQLTVSMLVEVGREDLISQIPDVPLALAWLHE